ncbi:MAG: dihydrofolate reductase [Flavisolibacter sp.]|jgi:dihydrofolate reductase|nr:dihydrofolate reductase [Flavisolibacter sp.]
MILSLLVAASENNVIGKNNQLPWHLPNDLRYFKNLTWGLPILMGRKTFESIGKPLPGRKNIVITRNNNWNFNGVDVVHTLDAAIGKAKQSGVKEIFVIGGAEIFKAAFPIAHRLYLTKIHHAFEGDVYLEGMNPGEWTLLKNTDCSADDKNAFAHSFQIWERT